MHAILTGNDMFEHLLLPRESLSPSLVSFLIARASFIQIYSHFAKKKKKEEQKQQKVTQNLQFFSSDKKIPNLSIPRVEKKVFIQQLSQKKKEKNNTKDQIPLPLLLTRRNTPHTIHATSPLPKLPLHPNP